MSVEIHTAEQPKWLDALVETVLECVTPDDSFMGPLGYRWWEPDNAYSLCPDWVLAVYPTPYDARGGAADGGRCVSGFSLDVKRLAQAFAEVNELRWDAPVRYYGDLDCPALTICGKFAGKKVQLRVFHLPPSDEPSACAVDAKSGAVTRL